MNVAHKNSNLWASLKKTSLDGAFSFHLYRNHLIYPNEGTENQGWVYLIIQGILAKLFESEFFFFQ